jgi:hypothetical protein
LAQKSSKPQRCMNTASQASTEEDFHKLSAQSDGRDQRNRTKHFYNLLFVSPGDAALARLAGALLNRQKGYKYRTFVMTPERRGPAGSKELERELEECLRKSRLDKISIEEAPRFNSPPIDFVIIFDDDDASEILPSWSGNPDVMKWHITRPLLKGERVDRERSFRRTLCELETRLNLFCLVHEKSQREAAATGRPLLLAGPSTRTVGDA